MSSRQGLGPRKNAPLLDSARHQSTRPRTPSGFSSSPAGPLVVGSLPRRYGRGWLSLDHNPRIYPHHDPPRHSDPTHLARGRLLTHRGVALPAPYSYSTPRRRPLRPPPKKSKISRHRRQSDDRRPSRHPRHRTRLYALLHRCRFRTLPRPQMDESFASLT